MGWMECGAFLVGGFLFNEAVSLMYSKYFPKRKPSEIRFVRYTNKICKGHVFSKSICSAHLNKADQTFECAYSIILWMVEFFDLATETLDISIYLVTCEAFRDAILRAHLRGVRVRIFADLIMAQGSGSAVSTFIKAGIPLRMMELSRMMHRKSAIVDGKSLLLGTGNWTMQALAGNWDIWYQTSEPEIVSRFSEEFEVQWAMPNLMQPTLEEFAALRVHK